MSTKPFNKIYIKAGYAPGERIRFEVRVSNNSNKRLKPLKVNFYQKVRHHRRVRQKSAHKWHTKSRSIIPTVSSERYIEPHEEWIWNDERSSFIVDLSTHHSFLHRATSLSYELCLKVEPCGILGWRRILKIPIEIGE